MTTQAVSPELQYPIGKASLPTGPLSAAERKKAIETISELPVRLRAAVAGLTHEQLDTPYRPGGWTVRQVVHHLADAHVNGFLRFKLALTENEPTIKPYNQEKWANTADSRTAPIDPSLHIVDGVHERLTTLLTSMKPADFARKYQHPERGPMTLDTTVAMYAWHAKHHVAHITELRKRKGW